MRTRFLRYAVLCIALLGTARAQLNLVTGTKTQVVTQFNFYFDGNNNQVSVYVDNTVPGPGGVRGTLTSFGFNTPSISIAQSATLIFQQWTKIDPLHTPAPTMWTRLQPYDLRPRDTFIQDFGVTSGSNANGGNPPNGIWFGERAMFVFQFADFDSAAGFLGTNGVSARWQNVENSVRRGDSDKGIGSVFPSDLGPIPEPSTYGLMGAGALGAMLFVRRRVAKRVLKPADSPAV